MRRAVLAMAFALFLAGLPSAALADDGWGWRRTTPRADVDEEGDELLIAIPGGRAWGLQSALFPLPATGTVLSAEVEVRDPAVSEVFLRVAYYSRGTGRPRQLSIADSAAARPGGPVLLSIPVEPPAGARAYRLRVLGRLAAHQARSVSAGIRVAVRSPVVTSSPARPPLTRLAAYPR